MNSIENEIFHITSTRLLDALDILFRALRCISRNEREQIVRAKTGRAPCRALSIPRVKILDSKVCYRRTCERDDAEEVEETDIPGISVWFAAATVSGCNRRLQSWISSLTIVIQ